MSEWHSSRIDIIGNTGGNNVGINNGTINNATHHCKLGNSPWLIEHRTYLFVIDGDQKSLKQLAEDTDANKGKRRHAGTCEWLLRTPDYQTWSRMESQYSVLWIHGHSKCLEKHVIQRLLYILILINAQWDAERQL